MALFPSKIKITSRPQGDAPEWVRNAWVGVVLECVPHTCGHVPMHSTGVVTGRVVTTPGYDVSQAHALERLAAHEKEAGGKAPANSWWREHGLPLDGECFRFDAGCAEVLESIDVDGGERIIVHDDIETGTMRPVPTAD